MDGINSREPQYSLETKDKSMAETSRPMAIDLSAQTVAGNDRFRLTIVSASPQPADLQS